MQAILHWMMLDIAVATLILLTISGRDKVERLTIRP
jgi:hypothetical protein